MKTIKLNFAFLEGIRRPKKENQMIIGKKLCPYAMIRRRDLNS
jgi:hypothetical protein